MNSSHTPPPTLNNITAAGEKYHDDDSSAPPLQMVVGGDQIDVASQSSSLDSSCPNKRKLVEVYDNNIWNVPDKYVVRTVKEVIRNQVFHKTKFVKGEGSVGRHKRKKKMGYGSSDSLTSKASLLGETHERQDLTQDRGYAYEILKACGVLKKNIHDQGLWWKTYNKYVKEEISQFRGEKNYSLRSAVMSGKLVLVT